MENLSLNELSGAVRKMAKHYEVFKKATEIADGLAKTDQYKSALEKAVTVAQTELLSLEKKHSIEINDHVKNVNAQKDALKRAGERTKAMEAKLVAFENDERGRIARNAQNAQADIAKQQNEVKALEAQKKVAKVELIVIKEEHAKVMEKIVELKEMLK